MGKIRERLFLLGFWTFFRPIFDEVANANIGKLDHKRNAADKEDNRNQRG